MSLEWKDYEDFWKKCGRSNSEIFPKWTSWFFILEATGLLIKNKIVKAELIYDLGGYGAIGTWEKYKDVIQSMRKDPTMGWVQDMFSNAEFFAQEMQKVLDSRSRNEARFKDK